MAIIIYIILLIIIAIAVIWCCSALIAQLNRAINALTRLATDFDPSALTTDLIMKFSKENGGFLTESMIAPSRNQ